MMALSIRKLFLMSSMSFSCCQLFYYQSLLSLSSKHMKTEFRNSFICVQTLNSVTSSLIIFTYSILPFHLYLLSGPSQSSYLIAHSLAGHAQHWTWGPTRAQQLLLRQPCSFFSLSHRTTFSRGANVYFHHLIRSESRCTDDKKSRALSWHKLVPHLKSINSSSHELSVVNLPGLQMPWH